MKTIHAIYEQGVFRPLEKVELPEKTEVEVVPCLVESPKQANTKMEPIYAILSERYDTGEHDVAARHNEHQP